MTHISELLISYIDHAELNDHTTSVVEVVQKSKNEDPTLIEITDTLSGDNDLLTLAISQERKSKYTELIKKLDNLRDNWFKCIKGHAIADIKCPEFQIATAAQNVFRIISNHGVNLHTESYEKESALLKSLFVDLDKAPLQADLETLGLTKKYRALKSAQKEFKATYIERSETESAEEPVVSASIVQKTVKPSLELVTDYIKVMISTGKAPFMALAKAINYLTDNINTKIRARITAEEEAKKKKENKKDQDNNNPS